MLKINDFSDLYVIAVGLAMTYIFFNSKDRNLFPFSKFLESIYNSVLSVGYWFFNLIAKKNETINETMAEIESYLESVSDNTVLCQINKTIKENAQKLNDLDSYLTEELKKGSNTNYINTVAFDCFLFGLFVLYIGAFQETPGYVKIMLLCMECFVVLVSIINSIRDSKSQYEGDVFFNSKTVHLFLMIILGVFAYKYGEEINFDDCYFETTIMVAPFVCFSEFISYILMSTAFSLYRIIRYCIPQSYERYRLRKNIEEEIDKFNEEKDNIGEKINSIEIIDTEKIETKEEDKQGGN